MNYTTIEQSKKLLELGLKPETADMSYGNFCVKGLGYCDQFRASLTPYTKEVEIYEENKKAYGIDKYDGVVAWEVLPCWSLNKLMELLPPSINHYDEADRCNKNYGLNLFRSYYHCCGYSFGPSLSQENHDTLYCCGGDTWIEAVYKTIIWGVQQGYLKV